MFTFLVSTYNRPFMLKKCLHSIKAQKYKNFEAIILDDCSTMDNWAVVKEFIQDNRFKYIRFEKNHGQAGHLINFMVNNDLVKYNYIIDLADDDTISDNFLLKCFKMCKYKPDVVAVDACYSFGSIIVEQYATNLKKSKILLKLKTKDIISLNRSIKSIFNKHFFIKNHPFKIHNDEMCEIQWDKYYKFASFAYAKGAKYIFSCHAGNRRKYTKIDNWINSMALVSYKNADVDGKIDMDVFSQSFKRAFNDESIFIRLYEKLDADTIVLDILKQKEDLLASINKTAKKYADKYQAEFDKKYLALNAKLYTYEERNEIIDSSKSFMVYCNTPWGKQIKKQLKQKGLKFLGYIDDGSANKLKNTITCDEFFSSNLKPDFVFIATGRPKLMSDLIDKLSTGYSGKILTLHERDDGA